ncbi:transmembrane protein 154 isoform X2 [Cyclopterus lumpus]|uniref:transmembrane protein 154 isoform X2 n=1 Tax=Cyclopterus lumpus TaxID=8103 RepID=UPI0014869740|nr:transmembrane protein 154 isoform X2 [Cyclopterus lumpus]
MIYNDGYDDADTETQTTEEDAIVAETDVNGDTELLSEPSDSDATAAPDDSLTVDIQNTDEEGRGSGGTAPGNETFDPTADGNVTDPREGSGDSESLSPTIILVPVVLVFIIIGMIVCGIFINRRWNQKVRNQELRKEDPYLDGSSTEKVPMPMFEEDVPSVLELEMEELDQWMKKDVEPAEDSIHA